MRDHTIQEIRELIQVDDKRDELLTEFGKVTLKDRYCLPGESYQDVFARAAVAFCGGDYELAQRIYDYASKLWLSFATPLISNGGTTRGLPISCFLNYVDDSIRGLADNFDENAFLATSGGGIGSFWGHVRAIGEVTSKGVETPGPFPFMHCIDSQMLAYHQGNTRRGAAAMYMDISHPEIIKFINMRKPTGDENARNENLHHGIGITDDFMIAVRDDLDWQLTDPKSGNVHETVKARTLWANILTTRLQTGEPYLFFKDTTNEALPDSQKALGLKVHHSNLCTEITLATSKERTAVCCLSSLNIAKYEEWEDVAEQVVADCVTMLDNVLDVFIQRAPKELWRAVNSANRERSIGLGTLGFHTYLQENMVDIESPEARAFNVMLFKQIKTYAVKQSQKLAKERGEPSDMLDTGMRHAHLLSVAPNATSSIICGTISPSIEPIAGGSFAQKTKSGTKEVRNPALVKLLKSLGKDTEEVWSSISLNDGSVQHLDFLTDRQKAVYKTAVEIDQERLIQLAADRQKYICQAQSLNLFVPPNISTKMLHKLHFSAWDNKLKSLYYLRSDAEKGTEKIGNVIERNVRKEFNCTDEVCTMCEG